MMDVAGQPKSLYPVRLAVLGLVPVLYMLCFEHFRMFGTQEQSFVVSLSGPR